jgi:mevalonate kinase
MVWAARDADALGAKLTGAGGGGCIVALDPTDETATALDYTPGCERAFRAELDTDGVRVEEGATGGGAGEAGATGGERR